MNPGKTYKQRMRPHCQISFNQTYCVIITLSPGQIILGLGANDTQVSRIYQQYAFWAIKERERIDLLKWVYRCTFARADIPHQ